MEIKKIIYALPLLLIACSQAAPYQSIEGGRGYWESMGSVERESFRVTFNGGTSTNYETVQTYWLYRCAKIAIERGYSGFELLTDVQLVQNVDEYQPSRAYGGSVTPFIRSGSQTVGMLFPLRAEQPTIISAEIRLIKGDFTAAPPKSYNAAKLVSQLEPWVKGEKCNRGNVCPHAKPYLRP